MDEASLTRLRADLEGEAEDGLLPDNVPIVAAFLAIQTQWRTAPIVTAVGGTVLFLGLDYAGVRAGLEAAAVEVTPRIWAGLRVMEGAATAALNKG